MSRRFDLSNKNNAICQLQEYSATKSLAPFLPQLQQLLPLQHRQQQQQQQQHQRQHLQQQQHQANGNTNPF
ncbi:GM12669 [Drosophila sechellia]|uniref:GD16278 n=2 Tax=melanogaster subgroup TaxID=32351 RepID=B4R4Q0_DROSI|nr:GM12669 [Drosophila sechellia]EDX17097.1 GD16278 [Drosophila simulans]